MKLLVIEDDIEMAEDVASRLRDLGHKVEVVGDGRQGLAAAFADAYDVLVVDRMLPTMDGLSLVRTLRKDDVRTPVLFLTTMAGIDDRVEGLEAGGDDYLVKPFAPAELVARVNALGRRAKLPGVDTVLRVADLEIDLVKRTVVRAGQRIELQPREFQLLEFLMRHAGQVVTRTMLLENVWDFHFDPQTNIVETHISRLRSKVDRDFHGMLIQTIRGAGYLLRDPA
ncbi:DNA-binding response regulator [Alsobacter metallidurans]|uniref:DNA-binding response regulator n=1 Tax=Alsobacter metallidurans TaxID=340221 RepID=A0A917MKW7_9HYPH|nr:response regulator transcription factor [Alsobacter metallidurans]GGH26293.1 DNA-binding response regulator [Alsobacter metallidurans]